MDVPGGYRAEIIGGNIVMSPWPKGYYLRLTRSLRKQIEPHLPAGLIVDNSACLFSLPKQGLAIGPEVFVAADEAFDTHSRYIDGKALTLIAELTSDSTRCVGWDAKPSACGKAGVPVYLLLDMQDRTLSVFSDPTPLGYAERRTYAFGEKAQLPPPFEECELDTAGFGDMPGEETEEETEGE
jgi:hypothetical protein